MKLIRFRRLNGRAPITIRNGQPFEMWEIAFNEEHLRLKLNGDEAYIIRPPKEWYVKLWEWIRRYPNRFFANEN